MNKSTFKPEFWPTVMTLVMFVTIVGLGVWQLYRLEWKEGLMEQIHSQMAQPPVPLEEALKDMEANQYRRVLLTGTFLHDKELHMAAKYYRNILGYHLLTPFRLKDGAIVLVNRGWVPKERRDPETRPETIIKGRQTVEGVVHASRGKGLFTPDNDAPGNMWFWYDFDAMSAAAGEKLQPVVVDALRMDAGNRIPIGAEGTIELRNDHFAYAVTWFLLAAGLVVVYVVYHRQRSGSRG